MNDPTQGAKHPCGSCGRPHGEYETWCRAERERLFPANFRRQLAERPDRRSILTPEQRHTVWSHIDAWEACIDGDMTLAQTREYVATLEPLPSVREVLAMAKALAQTKTVRARPMLGPASAPEPLSREQERDLLAFVNPVPEPGIEAVA